MATMGGMAALLQIGVRADTSQAASALRRMDQTVQKTAAGTRTLTTAQQRSQASFREVASQMRITEAQARRLSASNQRLSRSSRDVDMKSRSLGTSLKGAAKWAGAAAAGYIGIGAAKDAISTTTELAKATIGLNRNLQLSVKVGSELAAQVKVRTGDTKGLTMVQKTLSTQIEAAKNGTESAVDAFQDLGVSVKELKTLSGDKLLFAIADGAKAAGDGTERTAALGKLLGRQFGAMGPLLRDGSASLKEQLKMADEAGASFKGMDISKLQELIQSERRAQLTSLGLKNSFTENLAPALTKTMNAFGDTIRWISKTIHWFDNLGGVVGAIAHFKLLDLISAAKKVGAYFAQGVKGWADTFRNFGQVVGNIAGKVKDVWQSIPGAIKSAFAGLGKFIISPFTNALSTITGFVNKIIDVINILPGVNIGHAGGGDTSTAGTGKQGRPHPGGKGTQRRARGGFIFGAGSGDTVPAMLEPGEFVLNRNAVSAIGSQELEKFNKTVARFGIGGAVGKATGSVSDVAKGAAGLPGKAIGAIGDLAGKLPGVGDLPAWIQPVGKFVLDKIGDFIKSKIPLVGGGGGPGPGGVGSYKGVPMANWVIQSLQYAARKGVSPQPTSGYRSHAENVAAGRNYYSEHEGTVYPHGAVDFGGYTTGLAQKMAVVGATSSFKWPLLAPIGFRDDGHASGTGHKLGGLIKGFQKGGGVGKISPDSPKNPAVGAQWIKDVGGHWDPNEIFTALRQLGAPKDMASFLSAVSVGESGGNPRAIGHDPGGSTGLGLLQMTWGVGNNALINKYGGRGGMMNPWQNMLAAMELYRSSGPGAWFGHRGGAGHLLLDRIKGPAGKTKLPKVPKKGKKGKGGGSDGGGGSDWLDLLLQAGEDRFTAASDLADIQNTRIASANELIGQGNLEALQRFQVGSSQNPILGLAKPGMPTPASLIPMMEPWQFLNQVSGSTGSASPSIHTPIDNVTPQGDLMGHTLPKRRKRRAAAVVPHTTVIIAGKEVRHATKTELRRAARGGHRPLPSRGGGL